MNNNFSVLFDSDVNYWSKSIPSMFYLSRYLWDIYLVWPHGMGDLCVCVFVMQQGFF